MPESEETTFAYCVECQALICRNNEKHKDHTIQPVKNFQIKTQEIIAERWIESNILVIDPSKDAKKYSFLTLASMRKELNEKFTENMSTADFNLDMLKILYSLHYLAFVKDKHVKISIVKN